jgi:rod shape-determining protein MreD
MKPYLLLLSGYLAFVWQAALRPELTWNGYAPNFLALALLLVMWSLSDISALIVAAVLGLLSDCLVTRSLGNDMLCFLVVANVLQTICPPRLVRHPGWLLVLVLFATFLIEVSTSALRGTLNHEISNVDGSSMIYLRWGLTALGDGLYTALLAALPVVGMIVWGRRMADSGHQPELNRWHRLTS